MRALLGLALGALLVTGPAAASTDVADADRIVAEARAAAGAPFCREPPRPLTDRQRRLCPLAAEVPDCQALRDACATPPPRPSVPEWLTWLLRHAGPLAQVLLYGLVIAVVVVVALPLLLAALRRRRARRVPRVTLRANVAEAAPPAPPVVDDPRDPEVLLAAADAELRRGEARRALGLYLAASLAALDRRGALRLAAHRTNGEYVRACTDAAARPELRAIVREVDRADYGGEVPAGPAVRGVADRARAVVRAAAVIVTALALAGCGGAKRGGDPTGDELPMEVLRRAGFRVVPLGTSLATLPLEKAAAAPITVVDLERVPLEDAARQRLGRWVEAGGTLVLLGRPERWPAPLAATAAAVCANGDAVLDADPAVTARLAAAAGLSWADGWPVAHVGDDVYAAKQAVGKGLVLGLASDDPFTNLGVLAPHGGALAVALLRDLARDTRTEGDEAPAVAFARTEDGVPPPSNPFAGLAAAGLGKGAWHALAAALLLFLAVGIRQARPRPVPSASRRAFLEHVEATGALYARTGAAGHALRVYARWVEHRLRELVPRGTDADAWVAQRTGLAAGRLDELLASARDGSASRSEALAALEELRAVLAALSR